MARSSGGNRFHANRPQKSSRKPARKSAGRDARARSRKEGRLPRNAPPISVLIEHIGGRGDGVGKAEYSHQYETKEHLVFVPATLPGERVLAQPLSITSQGIKARIIELESPVDARKPASCNAFPACGGCNFQHWQDAAISKWKQDQVAQFLERADLWPSEIRLLYTAPLASRRRATFHIKRLAGGTVAGFHERQGPQIINPEGCTILHPDLVRLLEGLRALCDEHFPIGVMIDATANMLDQGICLQLAVVGGTDAGDAFEKSLAKSASLMAAIGDWAAASGLARLSLMPSDVTAAQLTYGDVTAIPLYAPVPPILHFGKIAVSPPAGAFLQASIDGEVQLQTAVAEITKGAKSVVDLFAGCGTLSLPLLGQVTHLLAVEQDRHALASLKAGVDAAGLGARVTTELTDLINAPLTGDALAGVDAVILDPPRGGAANQCAALSRSPVPRIAMVSCNPSTFARDAEILCDGGYNCDWLQIIDQFRMSNHIELVAQFSRIHP